MNTRDIEVPAPVSWWPPAPGWWVILTVLVAITTVIGFRSWRRWQSNAYRRAALRELRAAKSVAEIAAILKRAALVAYPRSDVAALSGTTWMRWLEQTVGQPLSAQVTSAFTDGIYDVERTRLKVADFAAESKLQPWDGTALWAAFSQSRQRLALWTDDHATQQLPPLNPKAEGVGTVATG